MINRVKQFIRAITAKIDAQDIEFINRYLDEQEIFLFNKLSTYEKKHSLCVARYILKKIINDSKEHKYYMIKLGLLHDIGKIQYRLNVIDRVILVLLDRFTKGKIKKLKNKKVHIYFFHGEEGANILKNKGYEKSFIELIKNHHCSSIYKSKDMELLVEADNRN